MVTLDDFFSDSHLYNFARGEIVINPGQTPQGVYYLEEGFIKMNSVLPDGREITVNIFKPGSCFPLMWAFSDLPNTYSFQAMSQVSVKRTGKPAFQKFIRDNPEILFDLTNRLLIGLHGLLYNINHILSGDAYHRMIAAILMFSRRFGTVTPKGTTLINLKITHQDLADVAAITRETASINIKKLEKNGLISQKNRQIEIKNLLKLEEEIDIDNQDLPLLTGNS